jgi:Icc-related predicted phosphoesterase
MNDVCFIGDIHGNFDYYSKYLIADSKRSIQVGDFGIGFAGAHWHDKVSDWMIDNPNHQFIRGNHDDPARCKTMPNYIADGTVQDDMMFIGGAWSIDQAYRTPGVSWWEDEELSIEQFNTLIDVYATVRPNIMVTHDGPMAATDHMFIKSGLAMFSGKLIPTRTGQALQAMFEIHQPSLWVYGHWHTTARAMIGRTEFVCVGENDVFDVTLDDYR